MLMLMSVELVLAIKTYAWLVVATKYVPCLFRSGLNDDWTAAASQAVSCSDEP